MRRIAFVLCISTLLTIVGCGGSSHNSNSSNPSAPGGNAIVTSGNNVAPLIVDAGPVPAIVRDANRAFTTVVVCAPGTANCVTIDHIVVDTASTGLRIAATAFPAFPNGANVLAALKNVSPSTIAECVIFLDNTFFFGTVRSADVKMGGSSNTAEVASSVPIHVMGDVASIPADCTGTEADTVNTLGANGLLGVGTYQYDCDALGFGNSCTTSSTAPPGVYFTCPSSGCSDTPAPAVPLIQQVRNPVSKFATDNNGVILELPAVAVGGQSGISAGQASLVFGIGTQSNNGLGGAVVLTPDPNSRNADNAGIYAGITTVFNGVSYPSPSNLTAGGSFFDSGSNGIFFLDQPTSGVADCAIDVGFYCPSSVKNFTAVNQATGGNRSQVQFNVSNAESLLSTANTAFSDLAGPMTSGTPDPAVQASDGVFDWGLSFFYGRNVYTAIWGVNAPSGVPAGPFWAY